MIARRAALLLGLLAVSAPAALGAATPALLERLPGGARVVGFVDAAAVRSSPVLAGLDLEALVASGGLKDDAWSDWGGLGGELLDRVAFGGWLRGDEYEVVLLAEGRWELEALEANLLKGGAVEIQVAGRPAWKMPADSGGDVLVVAPLADGVLAVADYDLAASVHAGGAPLRPDLAREVAALPPGLSSWILMAEPSRAGGLGGQAAGLTQGLRTLGLWMRADDTLKIGASALAADSTSAAQLGAAVRFGLLALSGQAGGRWSEVVRALRFESSGERLDLGLELDAKQLAGIVEGLMPAAAQAVAPAAGAP